MTWTQYRITFRLLSPLHIGWFKQGNVQRTRPYVTGKALWGALTARLARDGANTNYAQVGAQVNDQLAFSYFFPSTKPDEVALWPWDDPREFAWRYLGTYASTALDSSRNAALDGSLHETECISPYTRDGEAVYLVGFIFEREGCALEWRPALGRLQIGGERTRGWGRIQPRGELRKVDSFWEGWQVDLTGDRPALRLSSLSKRTVRCFAHLTLADSVSAAGDIEPLVGRETKDTDQYGRTLVTHGVCWQPGAEVTNASASLCIAAYGIWRAADD